MKHTVPHNLPLDLAKKAADAALQEYRTKYPNFDPLVTWTDEHTAQIELKAKGLSLKGVFEILPDAVAMDMEVPLLLRPFKQKALEVIEQQILQWIDRAKNGQLA